MTGPSEDGSARGVGRRSVLAGMGLSLGLGRAAAVLAETPPVPAAGSEATVDARGAGLRPVRRGPIAAWGGTGPGGVLTANDCHLERDGRPLAIVAGELHIQRVPPEEWEPAIVQMKAAGLDTVSSYVFWNQIEPERGRFDFTGRNDLRTFFDLCRRHGMMAVLRPGPFCNAEFLTGGLPVWLFGLPTVERSNDALYLDLVRRYYAALAVHLEGSFWHQGGPIAIVQLENELSVAPVGWARPFLRAAPVVGHTGPTGAGFTEHYRHLHAMALQTGLRAPFYSATAWGTKETLPIDLVMPTFGGYMDLVPSGASNSPLTVFSREGASYDGKVPTGFIEIGYGTPVRDAFRPRPSPDDGYCATMTLFGSSRSLMIGYYMFRGGSNPVNGLSGWTTKDQVFPLVSYDFRAPIGEFGDWREALFRARPFNVFVREFAEELARAEPRGAVRPVADPDDPRVRLEGRFDGNRGFVFVSNFGNVRPLPPRPGFAVEVTTDRGAVRIPATGGVDLASGAMAVWPVNLDLGGGATLRSATAQPVCRLRTGDRRWLVLSQNGDVPVVLAIASAGVHAVRTQGRKVLPEGDVHVVRPRPGRGSVVEVTAADGSIIAILVLTEHDAQRMAVLGTPGSPLLAISEAMVTRSGDVLSVASDDPARLSVSLFPAPAGGRATRDGVFGRMTFRRDAIVVPAGVRRLDAGRAVVTLPSTAFEGVDDVIMDVRYLGDVCRLFDAATGFLLADDMNDGRPWPVGLRRFRRQLASEGVLVRAEPVEGADAAEQRGAAMTLGEARGPVGAVGLESVTFRQRHVVKVPVA